MLLVLLYSLFDGNHGADGSAINLAYYNVNFDNVTFSNNVGSAVRVSEIILHQDTVVCRAAQVNGASAKVVSILLLLLLLLLLGLLCRNQYAQVLCMSLYNLIQKELNRVK